MPFIEHIVRYRTVSIVGLAKNAGKTECLNYVLSRIGDSGKTVAVTSIGTDGESLDQVTRTQKPEIWLRPGMLFVTTEQYYREKNIVAGIRNIGIRRTALGKLLIGEAHSQGKVILSGPPDTGTLKELQKKLFDLGADIIIVDGALSRTSSASSAVSEAMILVTGASVSANPETLVRLTSYMVDKIKLPGYEGDTKGKFDVLENGIWSIGEDGKLSETGLNTGLSGKFSGNELVPGDDVIIYVAGALTDRFLGELSSSMPSAGAVIIVKDFTRIFAEPETFYGFLRKGGKILQLNTTELIAVCFNPQSPAGYRLNSAELTHKLEKRLGLPVYDVRMIGKDVV